jgi:hypothetical protein
MLRRAAIVLSLANLCFFGAWGTVLPGSPQHYFMKFPPARLEFGALILNVALLAMLFLAGYGLARRAGGTAVRTAVQWTFLAVLVVALNGIRLEYPTFSLHSLVAPLGSSGSTALEIGVGMLVVAAVIWRLRVATSMAVTVVLLLFPFFLFTCGRAIWTAVRYDRAFGDFAEAKAAPLGPRHVAGARRVVWLIFDELDQRLAFVDRPPRLDLPEFDRLRQQSIYATNAYPPAGETLVSLPALLTGQRVWMAHAVGTNDLTLTLADSHKQVRFGSQPDIFSAYHAAGLNTALVGYYHSYCRVFEGRLNSCWWQTYYFGEAGNHLPAFTLGEAAIAQIGRVLGVVPFSRYLAPVKRLLNRLGGTAKKRWQQEIHLYSETFEAARRVVGDPRYDLVFVHLPVPHTPYIYNRTDGEFLQKGSGSYFDNLALADRTFGELRAVMEHAGVWQNTDVLVTSDHWYRTPAHKAWRYGREDASIGHRMDYRVPLLLKLAGQETGITYDRPFNTIIIEKLLLARASEISGPASVPAWLDAHASMIPPVCGELGGQACPNFPDVAELEAPRDQHSAAPPRVAALQ